MQASLVLAAAISLLCTSLLTGEEETTVPPIVPIKGAQPGLEIFKSAKRGKPLELKSADEAAKHFGEDALAALQEKVDFEKQIVLVFAWRGSGQDKLNYDVAESFPEQIAFKIKPGRTRDLRQHVHVYALRNDVTWSVGR